MIIYTASIITKAHTAPPVASVIILLKASFPSSEKAVSIAVSSVSIETQAQTSVIAFEAEKTGLSKRLNLTALTTAEVNEVKVYAASAIVVI